MFELALDGTLPKLLFVWIDNHPPVKRFCPSNEACEKTHICLTDKCAIYHWEKSIVLGFCCTRYSVPVSSTTGLALNWLETKQCHYCNVVTIRMLLFALQKIRFQNPKAPHRA